MEHFDLIIIGAGISGIDMAYYMAKKCPDRSFVVLERAEKLGGTWQLFNYPGLHSICHSVFLTGHTSQAPVPIAVLATELPADDACDHLVLGVIVVPLGCCVDRGGDASRGNCPRKSSQRHARLWRQRSRKWRRGGLTRWGGIG